MFDDLDGEALEAEITTLAGNLHAGMARFLALVGELDARGSWSDWGVKSSAHWLEWRCGLSAMTAREQVRVARALRRLPRVADAFATGALSYSKVRAITRIGTDATEDLLLMWAHHATAAQLERIVRGVRFARAVSDPTERHRQRTLSWTYDEDGSLLIRARLEPEEGMIVVRALEAAIAAAELNDVSAETSARLPDEGDPWGIEATTPAEQARADALVTVAEAFLASGEQRLDPESRAAVMVHIDADALMGGSTGGGEIAEGPPLHQATVRRLSCDGALVASLDRSDGARSIGRRSRVVPRRMRRALIDRDRTCRFPSCLARKTDAHHVRHWADGGDTALSNLLLLCRRHHRLIHEYGFVVRMSPDGAAEFVRPDGRAITPVVTRGAVADLLDGQRHRAIDHRTCSTQGGGYRPDYGSAVEGVIGLDEHGAA